MKIILRKLQLGCMFATLLLLGACGGKPNVPAPSAPGLVVVTPGPNVLHVTWLHEGDGASEYVVYREPRDGSTAKAEIARVSRDPNDHHFFSYMDEDASDETKVRYRVVAVGPGGVSEATAQIDGAPTGLSAQPESCVIHKPTWADYDGDGLSDAQELSGWSVSIGQGTATIDNVSGTWQQDVVTETARGNPDSADTDGDGLCDMQEMMHRTYAYVDDSDGDGLTDLVELDTWASDPTNVDTDIDSFNPKITVENNKETAAINQAKGNPELYDGSELNTYHTSPTLFDSDGDTYSDYNEIIVRGDPFNPLIANLPEIELSLSGEPYLQVDIAYSDSSKQAETKTNSLQQGTSSSNTDTSSTTWKEWASLSETIKVSMSYSALKGLSASGSSSTTVASGFSHVKTTGWSKTSAQESQNTYSDATSTAREQGRSISGGEIGIGVVATNTGDVTFTLTKLGVTALQRDPDDPSSFRAIGQLDLSANLASGVNLGPGGGTGTLDASYQTTQGNQILELMANPSSLMFDVAYFSLSNESGLSYTFMEETTDARTVFLTIDYGNGDVVREHIASNVQRENGKIVGVSLKEALDILGIQYKTQERTDASGKSYTVLTDLFDNAAQEWVSLDQTNIKFWTTLVSGGETGLLAQDFDDITLQAGEDAFLLYVQDQDEDGLFLREEDLVGTSDQNKDSDSDGLSDYDEAKTGWTVTPPENLPPLYPHHVYPNPTLADADNDGFNDSKEKSLDTDPNNPDTDGDLLCDGSGSAANAVGLCTANSTPDPEPLVPRFVFLPPTSSPTPYSFTTAPNANTISAAFTLPVSADSMFGVRSNLRGPISGSFTFDNGGRTMTFTAENDEWWLPGEVLTVALSNIKHEGTETTLPVYQYRFRAATNKAGTFDDSVTGYYVATSGYQVVRSIVSGDFDQNGVLDLAYATTYNNPNETIAAEVSVSLQEGGTFGTPQTYKLTGLDATSIVAGDFNNDGRLDLAATMTDENQVAVLLAGSTRGAFNDPVYYTTGASPVSLATADFNADGNLDLVTADAGAATNSVLLGKGDGTFDAATTAPSGPNPTAVTTGDANGDGITDILTAFTGDSSWKGVFTNLGNGDGTFRQTGLDQAFTSAGTPVAIATGDFNGDGWLDVVTANTSNDVSLLLNDGKGDGVFSPQPNAPVEPNPTAVMTADFNGDGLLDIAVANQPDGAGSLAMVLYNQGSPADSFMEWDIGPGGSGGEYLNAYGLTTILLEVGADANNQPLTLVVVGGSAGSPNQQIAFIEALQP